MISLDEYSSSVQCLLEIIDHMLVNIASTHSQNKELASAVLLVVMTKTINRLKVTIIPFTHFQFLFRSSTLDARKNNFPEAWTQQQKKELKPARMPQLSWFTLEGTCDVYFYYSVTNANNQLHKTTTRNWVGNCEVNLNSFSNHQEEISHSYSYKI